MKTLRGVVTKLSMAGLAAVVLGASSMALGVCGPFTDVVADGFCPFVLELFTLGITTGTTPTTYDPTASVSRLQMAAFLSRSVDAVLKRGGRRAALRRFWTPQNSAALGLTTVGLAPRLLKSDGTDVWVASEGFGGTVARVRGTDGKLLETWTGATEAESVLVAMGRVFVSGATGPGRLYRIDRTQPAGAVTTVASTLGFLSIGIAYDGARIWTANRDGSVSIATPGASIPWTVTTVVAGTGLYGALFDGTSVWVTDDQAGTLVKLDANGAILQTVTVGAQPKIPAFDGGNIWVPNQTSGSVSVVRAGSGAVLQTLTGNGLTFPYAAASDGQRILVTNPVGGIVSLWKAADLTPLGSFPMPATGSQPLGACSDGVNFWIVLGNPGLLARF